MKTNKNSFQYGNHLFGRICALLQEGEKTKEQIQSWGEFLKYQRRLKNNFAKYTAGIDYSLKCKSAQITGVLTEKNFSVEKIMLTCAENTNITANLYKPATAKAKCPAVIFACGHSLDGKAAIPYQKAAQALVNAGLTVLIYDQMGQGERLNYFNTASGKTDIGGTIYEHSYNGNKAMITGVPLNHYFIRDAMCVIDYLTSRQDIDPENIGFTGPSGGGTMTAFIMMSQDSRIKAFAPAVYITEFLQLFDKWLAQDDEQIVSGMIGGGYNYDDFILACLPKPVNILAASHDFFPSDGAIRAYQSAERFYKMFGCKDSLQLTVDNAVHGFSAGLAASAARFFAKHLSGNNNYIAENTGYILQSADSLNATPMGQVKFLSGNICVSDEITGLLKGLEANRNDSASGKKAAVNFFKEAVFNGRSFFKSPLITQSTDVCRDVNVRLITFNSLPDIVNAAAVYSADGDFSKVTICFTGSKNRDKLIKRAKEYPSTAFASVDLCNYGMFKPRKIGAFKPYDFLGYNYHTAHLSYFCGDSTGAFMTFEIMSAILNFLSGYPEKQISVYAAGNAEPLAAIAVLLLSELKNISVPLQTAGLFKGYGKIITSNLYNDKDLKSYIIPGVVKYCDYDILKKWIKE